jgi:N-glycosylase/DNA lyase
MKQPDELDKNNYFDCKGTTIDFDLYWLAYHNYIYEHKIIDELLSFTRFIEDGVSDEYIQRAKQKNRKLKIKEIFDDID